jgi:hypothetical protein
MEANQRRVAFFNTRSGLPFRCIPANDGADTPRRPLPGSFCCHLQHHDRKEMAGYLVSQLAKYHCRADVLGWTGPDRRGAWSGSSFPLWQQVG